MKHRRSSSADLGPSCKTRLTFDTAGDFDAENRSGRNLHFGIREHAMAAILNGLSLSKIRPFGWARYAGATGCTIGMETFGASAPLKELQRKFGFTPGHIVAAAKEQIYQRGERCA